MLTKKINGIIYANVFSYPDLYVSKCAKIYNSCSDKNLTITQHAQLYHVINFKGKSLRVNRLVFEAWAGQPIPKAFVVMHRDDDPGNNVLDNLVLGTIRANILDMRRKGRAKDKGRLGYETRQLIRDAAGDVGFGRATFEARFGIPAGTLSNLSRSDMLNSIASAVNRTLVTVYRILRTDDLTTRPITQATIDAAFMARYGSSPDHAIKRLI